MLLAEQQMINMQRKYSRYELCGVVGWLGGWVAMLIAMVKSLHILLARLFHN